MVIQRTQASLFIHCPLFHSSLAILVLISLIPFSILSPPLRSLIMDQTYQAKLSGSPPGHNSTPNPQLIDDNGDIHIQPMPNPHPLPQGQGQGNQPIPVQLPNIYVTAPSPQVPRRERDGTSHHHTQHLPEPHQGPRMVNIGPFRFTKPHPLLWITLGLSLIALVLEVPKGSLPTLTGRHRQLRVCNITCHFESLLMPTRLKND
jgi:hypothetical protein